MPSQVSRLSQPSQVNINCPARLSLCPTTPTGWDSGTEPPPSGHEGKNVRQPSLSNPTLVACG